MPIKEFLEFELFSVQNYSLKIYTLGELLLVFVIAKTIIWGAKKAFLKNQQTKKFDKGTLFSLYIILKYVVWTIAIAVSLEILGIKLGVLLAGSAALLVGVGLGLQQTFFDFISGIILLTERSIKVGDILEVDGDVVKIEHIGVRTSSCLNRNDVSVIIPNSSITSNKVINWSHQSHVTRFHINVGVSYNSDMNLVQEIITSSAKSHSEVIHKDKIEVQLIDFGLYLLQISYDISY